MLESWKSWLHFTPLKWKHDCFLLGVSLVVTSGAIYGVVYQFKPFKLHNMNSFWWAGGVARRSHLWSVYNISLIWQEQDLQRRSRVVELSFTSDWFPLNSPLKLNESILKNESLLLCPFSHPTWIILDFIGFVFDCHCSQLELFWSLSLKSFLESVPIKRPTND